MVYPSDQDGGIDLLEIAGTLWRGRRDRCFEVMPNMKDVTLDQAETFAAVREARRRPRDLIKLAAWNLAS